jgi:hypothetical protein
VNWYSNRLLPLISNSSLFRIELTSLWIADSNILPPAWISSARILPLPGDLYFFNFAIAISTSIRLGPGTNDSAFNRTMLSTSRLLALESLGVTAISLVQLICYFYLFHLYIYIYICNMSRCPYLQRATSPGRRSLSPRANYIDRATAACRRS